MNFCTGLGLGLGRDVKSLYYQANCLLTSFTLLLLLPAHGHAML